MVPVILKLYRAIQRKKSRGQILGKPIALNPLDWRTALSKYRLNNCGMIFSYLDFWSSLQSHALLTWWNIFWLLHLDDHVFLSPIFLSAKVEWMWTRRRGWINGLPAGEVTRRRNIFPPRVSPVHASDDYHAYAVSLCSTVSLSEGNNSYSTR